MAICGKGLNSRFQIQHSRGESIGAPGVSGNCFPAREAIGLNLALFVEAERVYQLRAEFAFGQNADVQVSPAW
ncbi:MAG TPA: hypothetical protein VKG02_02035, partial [Blastocatellia bacterium]|nr:hypothetical protein [Blastocatellia bacterium]